jgi:hypothetical protein
VRRHPPGGGRGVRAGPRRGGLPGGPGALGRPARPPRDRQQRRSRGLSGERVAAYVAKYATKAAETVGPGLDRPITSGAEIDRLELPEHARRLLRACWELGVRPELAGLEYAGIGYTTAGDAWLAWSMGEEARRMRRVAREALWEVA